MKVWVATLTKRRRSIPAWGNGHEFQLAVFDSRAEALRWRKRVAPSTVIQQGTLTIDEPKEESK
jgi:hypothetical protein